MTRSHFSVRTRRSVAALLTLVVALGLLRQFALDRPAARAQAPVTATSSAIPVAPHISSPVPGQDVQGVVEITGSTSLDGFTSYVLDFGYAEDQSRTWFAIASGVESITNGVLARWDTTSITDGNYRLRLRVFSSTDETKRYIVEDVRIRNYTPLDTVTPAEPAAPSLTPTATPTFHPTPTRTLLPTATATLFPSPTPLPPNPAELAPGQIRSGALRGAVATLVLFAIFGLLIRLRRN